MAFGRQTGLSYVVTLKRYLLVVNLMLLGVCTPVFAWYGSQMKSTTSQEEAEYIPLKQPPPPYSYKKGSMFRYVEDGKRMIEFNGTTRLPVYKNYVPWNESHPWFKRRKLSRNRIEFDYAVNCNAGTFDRLNDALKVRQVGLDWTAYAVWEGFCPEERWQQLPEGS